MYALWSEKNPEVNDAGDSRVGGQDGGRFVENTTQS